MWNRQFTYNKLCKTPLWNHLGSNKLHTREPSDTTGYIQNKKNFTMRVRLLCGAHVVWDCLFNTGYPGFGVPVPLFIGYLISNLILLKTNVIMSRDPKSVKSLARVWLCVGLVFLVSHCCIPWSLTQINTTFAVYSINNYKTVTLDNTASAMKTTQRAVPSFKKWQILEALHKNWSYIPGGIQIQSTYKSQQQMNTDKNK